MTANSPISPWISECATSLQATHTPSMFGQRIRHARDRREIRGRCCRRSSPLARSNTLMQVMPGMNHVWWLSIVRWCSPFRSHRRVCRATEASAPSTVARSSLHHPVGADGAAGGCEQRRRLALGIERHAGFLQQRQCGIDQAPRGLAGQRFVGRGRPEVQAGICGPRDRLVCAPFALARRFVTHRWPPWPLSFVRAGTQYSDHAGKIALRPAVREREDRPGHRAEPLLSGAPLHGHGPRPAADAGGDARDEGRGRLGRGLHRVLLDPSELGRSSLSVRLALGRRRPRQSRRDGRGGTRAWRARRHRAVARRQLRREPLDPTAPLGRAFDALAQRSGAVPAHGQARHPRVQALAPRGGAAGAQGRLRHRLRLSDPRLPGFGIPVAQLERPHRRIRRLAREPRCV